MYCPKCSATNETGQKYCRQCGLPLTTLQLAIDGRVDEALAQYKKGGGSLFGGTVALALCLLGALINMFLIPGPWNGYVAVANLIIGLVIALPMIIAGHVRLSRASHLLSSAEQSPGLIKPESPATAELFPPATLTEGQLPRLPMPGSVTEGTTLNLKSPERPSLTEPLQPK